MHERNPLRRFFSTSTAQASPAPATLLHGLLDPGGVGIVSASCCHAMASAQDETLAQNLAVALQQAGLEQEAVFATITETRQALQSLGADATPDALAFRDALTGLFQGQGLAIFPVLTIGGAIAFYGGVPQADAIAQRLQSLGARRG